MIEVKDFFIEENRIEEIPDTAYEDVNTIIQDINAFARTTHKSVYVIDYYRQNFLHVSDNPVFLCGMSAEEVKELGYRFYINQVIPQDLQLLVEINIAGFQFLTNIASGELCDYTIICDFCIVNAKTGKINLINHQITPFRLSKSGKVWLALCAASVSSGNESGNIIITKNKSKDYWIYNRDSRTWNKVAPPDLKDIEIEVLKLSVMGYTMNEIAGKIHRSFHTVKIHRKNLFKKLGVKNIAEAINLAMTYKIL